MPFEVPDRGAKHRCFQCQTLFYDLKRPKLVCPRCGVDQASEVKAAPAKKGRKAAPAPVKAVEEPAEVEAEEEEAIPEVEEEDDDEPEPDED